MESAEHADKDCRTCRLRRIRCDRAAPRCSKCTNRGLPCPGYGTHLRWTNAIASRGRFKGLATPRAKSDEAHGPTVTMRNATLIPSPPPRELLSEAVLDQLLQYYAVEMAPLNVWVESSHNEYRRLVIPLARSQRALRLAISGIAAAAYRPIELENKKDTWAGTDADAKTPRISQAACQEAVRLVTDQFRKLAGMQPEELHTYVDTDRRTPNAMLAATLVLANYSLLKFELPAALLHLQGARGLIRTLALDKASEDGLFVFLRNQVASLNILACTTLFKSNLIWDAVLPDLDHGYVLFGDYLVLIHSITMRSMLQEHSDVESQGDRLSPCDLEDAFELARGTTLMASGQLLAPSCVSYRHDVARLVKAYHHAGLVYAYLRLCNIPTSAADSDDDTEEFAKHHCVSLFQTLEQFENIDAFAGSLPWPIMIAGIASRGNSAQMESSRRLSLAILQSSPFKYYACIATFLEEFWRSSHGDWTVLARKWEENGTPLLAV